LFFESLEDRRLRTGAAGATAGTEVHVDGKEIWNNQAYTSSHTSRQGVTGDILQSGRREMGGVKVMNGTGNAAGS